MKTTEYTVLKQYAEGYKKGQNYVDAQATATRLRELFRQKNVKAPHDSYTVRVSTQNTYGRGGLKFRVYLGNSRPIQTFIQSDDNGALDIDKLLHKAHEVHGALLRQHETWKWRDAQRNERTTRARELNAQITRPHFHLDMVREDSTVLNMPALTNEQAQKLVNFINAEL